MIKIYNYLFKMRINIKNLDRLSKDSPNKEKKENIKTEEIKASVVIVTYNNIELLLKNLDSLKNQTIKNFEIILIDNNNKIDLYPLLNDYQVIYKKLYKNYGPCLGRNIGIKYAKGDIVIFLDDDAIPANDFVEQHIKAYRLSDIYGLRGKSLPRKSGNIYNYFAGHYDLGEKIIPWYINLEGNSSFKKEILINIGGFNMEINGAGGHEGIELSYRILKKYNDKNKLVYYPEAIIYHDYSDNFIAYINKIIRHNKNKSKLENISQDIFNLIKEYCLNRNGIQRNSIDFITKLRLMLIKKSAGVIIKIHSNVFKKG